jgi:hypothetical protein
MEQEDPTLCRMCGRLMDQPDDPLSDDCGGDCWSCLSETDHGYPLSIKKVNDEIAAGLRPPRVGFGSRNGSGPLGGGPGTAGGI